MNHQPFRGWLLSEDELTIEQAQALQDHLGSCDDCRQIESSWKELEAVIDRSSQLSPVPGFVGRWQIRLVEQQQHQQKLRGWYMIGATSLVVISLFVLVIFLLQSLLTAPDAYVAAIFDRLMVVLSIFFTIRNLVGSVTLPGPFFTLLGMVFLFGIISFMCVLWLATYRKISIARREA
ncbi:MAG TPA: zf-HC2 domain-containing protein [Anaerolineales bacterium]|nr:zf-HC2 domain-containing protein [Anaerolineales bacterium]